MNVIAVGTYTVATPVIVDRGQEHAAYSERVRVEPGTYPLVATVSGEGAVVQLRATAHGTCVDAWYGRPADPRIGTTVEITIPVTPYWRGEADAAPAGVQLDAASGLVIESWSPREGERMSHYVHAARLAAAIARAA